MLEKKLHPLSLKQIQIEDAFWKEYMELVRNHVIPYQWEALNDRIKEAEPSYCIQNFRVAAKLEEGSFQGMVFQDSDVYKWLEAVAYSLMWHPDEKLEQTADETIDLIAAAQQPDGYLDTYYIINGLEKRFTNLMDHHELYCLGHIRLRERESFWMLLLLMPIVWQNIWEQREARFRDIRDMR